MPSAADLWTYGSNWRDGPQTHHHPTEQNRSDQGTAGSTQQNRSDQGTAGSMGCCSYLHYCAACHEYMICVNVE